MNAPEFRLVVHAPLSGVLVPLEQVPDPVFAQKIVGDGISLDPTSNELTAPVEGRITQLHSAHHALAITTDDGVEVLVHIGVDTVMLKGDGFEPLVKMGERVVVGQPLIRFDADKVALGACSLLTQILIPNGEATVRSMTRASGKVKAGKDAVLVLDLLARPAETGSATTGAAILSELVKLPNPVGLHARPAAILAAEAKKYLSEIRLVRGADECNAKSVVAIMALSTRHGEAVQIKATGPDAIEAARVLANLLLSGCGEAPGEAPPPAPQESTQPVPPPSPAKGVNENELVGVSASPGIAVGNVVQYRQDAIEVSEKGGTVAQESAHFETAVREAKKQLEELKAGLSDASKAQIMAAHQELLSDPELVETTIRGINAGQSAGFAWRAAFTQQAEQLEGLENVLLRERAFDIRDVGRRVLSLLAGVKHTQIVVPDNSILIAEGLTPSDTASLDPSKVLGFCTTIGGATSHVAILARSLGIPAICGIDPAALTLRDGTAVVLDSFRGVLHKNPTGAEVAAARARVEALVLRRRDEQAQAFTAAITADGHRIEVVANVRNAAETADAVANGGEGVGLLRSEFLFDDRDTAPSEEEQAAEYTAVARALGAERPLVIRTLDVGGDKPLPYLPLPKEDNPFLGLRGVRVSLDRPDLFRTQLRAILQAAPISKLHIMFPMITSIDEFRAAKQILIEEMGGIQASVKVGVMIEVPAAAALAETLAREADFFSIGTNDLTQYTLAMDRGHPKLAKQADALHPAVLKMIQMTVEGAHEHGKWVGICGGMASDTIAVPVLIGLGVDELSVSVPAIPAVKAMVKRLKLAECKALAAEVLRMGTPAEVRARLSVFAD